MNSEKTAFIFPGQGSQYVGMGQEIAAACPEAATLFAQADKILGSPFSDLCWNGPEDALNDTYNTQPAIFIASLACLAALQAAGYQTQPAFVAGHSLGEYVAYVVAGILSFEDGLQLVRKRGQLMKQAGRQNPGKMAAILKLDDDTVAEICEQATAEAGWVQIANHNSPGQIIISGSETGIDRAIALAKAAGARRAKALAVSVAAHSRLMKVINAEFEAAIQAVALAPPAVPVTGNITARPLNTVADIRAEMLNQLTAPVQWTASIRYMVEQGVSQFIEIGPKKVLSGLIKRIDKSVGVLNVEDTAGINALIKG